jgi:hypothetical protein
VVLGGRQRLPEQVKPGQQSVLDPQLSSSTRQAQKPADPLRVQVIEPQQPVPTPPSVGVHVEAAPAQHARPVEPCAHSSPSQHSAAVVQPVVPAGRQVAVVRHTPLEQRDPAQQSLSSEQESPSA